MTIYTPTSIKQMSTLQIAQISSSDIAAWSSADLVALSSTQIQALGSSQIAAIPASMFTMNNLLNGFNTQYISTRAIPGLSEDQLYQILETINYLVPLTASQIAAITTGQIHGWTGSESNGIVSSLRSDQIAALSTTQLQALTPAEFSAFSPLQNLIPFTTSQVAAFTTQQIAAIGSFSGDWTLPALPVTAFGAFSSNQLAAISTGAGLGSISSAQLENITTRALAGLTTNQIQTLTTVQISSLLTTQIAALSTVQIQALGSSQIAALTTGQIRALTPAELLALTPTQLCALSTTQIQALTTNQFQYFSIDSVAGFTAKQVASFTTQQIAVLEDGPVYWDLNCLTPAAFGGLSAAQIALIPWDSLAAYPTSCIQNIAVSTIPGLTASQFCGLLDSNGFDSLSNAQIAALTATQIAGLPSWGIPYILSSQLAAFSSSQFRALSQDSIAALTTLQIAALTAAQIGTLSGAQVAALTTIQLQALSTAQFANFNPISACSFSANQVAGFSTRQLAALVTSGPWGVQDLTPDALWGLSSSQVACISTAEIAGIPIIDLAPGAIPGLNSAQFNVLVNPGLGYVGMSNAQISALTTTQVQQLSTGDIGVLSSGQVAALSSAQVGALTTAQLTTLVRTGELPYLSAGAIPGLSTAQFGVIVANQGLVRMTSAQIGALTSSQFQRLSASQIQGLTSSQIPGLTAAQLAAITPAELSVWNVGQLQSISPNAMSGMTSAQIDALSHFSYEYAAGQFETVTPDHEGTMFWFLSHGSMSFDMYQNDEETVGGSTTVEQVYYRSWLAAMTNPTAQGSLATLTPTQIAALTTAQVQALNPSELNFLTSAQLRALTPVQVQALTLNQLFATQLGQTENGLWIPQFQSLSKDAIAALSTSQFNALLNNATYLASLTADQASGLTTSQMQTLIAFGKAGGLSPAVISGLSPTNILAIPFCSNLWISSAQLASICPAAVNGLNATEFARFFNGNAVYLTGAQIGVLSASEFQTFLQRWPTGGLTSNQIGGLTPIELQSISTSQLATLPSSQINGLTAGQMAALSSAQIAAIGNGSWTLKNLQPAALAGISPAEINYVHTATGGVGLNSLSQVQEDLLTPNAIAGMTPAQLANLSPSFFGAQPTLTLHVSDSVDTYTNYSDIPSADLNNPYVMVEQETVATAMEWETIRQTYTEAIAYSGAGLPIASIDALSLQQVASMSGPQLVALEANLASMYAPAGETSTANGVIPVFATISQPATGSNGLGNYLLYNLLSSGLNHTLSAPYTYTGTTGIPITGYAANITGSALLNNNAQLATDVTSLLQNNALDLSSWPALFVDALTTAQIASLKPVALATLSAAQVYNWSAAQWNALATTGHLVYLSDIALQSINPVAVSALSTSFVDAIPAETLAGLSPQVVAKLTSAQLAALTPDQVWVMTPTQLVTLGQNLRYLSTATQTPAGQSANLSTLAIEGLSGQQISAVQSIPNVALPGSPIASMTTSQLAAMSVNDLNNLPTSAFTQLSTQQVAALPVTTCLNLDLAIYSSLSIAQQAALQSAPANLLAPGQIAALPASAIAALSPLMVASLNAEQFAAMSLAQVQALTQTQIAAIPGTLIRSFTNATWAMFTSAQTSWFDQTAEQSVTSAQVQALTQHPGNWTNSQISVLANAAQTAPQLPTPNNSTARNVYLASLSAQIATAVPFLSLQLHPANSTQSSDPSRQAWNTLESENEEYKRVANVTTNTLNTMSASKQVRLAGSIFGAFSVAAEWIQDRDNHDPDKPKAVGIHMSQDKLQAVAWLVSALQVPESIIADKVLALWDSWVAARTQKQNITALANSLDITDPAEIDELSSAVQEIDSSNYPAAHITFLSLDEMLSGGSNSSLQTVTAVVDAKAGTTATVLKAESLPSFTSIVGKGIVRPLLKDGIFVISDVFGMLNTLPIGSGSTRDENISIATVMSLFTIGDMVVLGTDLIRQLASAGLIGGLTASESATLAQRASTISTAVLSSGLGTLGLGTDLLQAVLGTFGVIGAQQAYNTDSAAGNSSALAGDKVALDGAIANMAVNSGIATTALVMQGSSMAATFGMDGIIAATGVGIPVAVGLAVIQALLPNWNAAGAAITYANMESALDGEGRTVEGDIVDGTLAFLSAQDAVPILNWFSFAFTPGIMATIYSEMMNGGMSLALSQDYAWNLTSSTTGQVYVAQLEAQIQMSQATQFASGVASTLSDVLVITAQTADAKAYMASSTKSTLYYLESLDVTGTGYTTTTTPTGQLPSTNAAQTITLSDQGTGWKMVEINSILTTDSWSATQPIVVDATSASESMQFVIRTQNATVYGGSGSNIYSVDMSVPAGYTIVGGSSGKDVVQFTSSAVLQSGTIKLDGISNAQVKASSNVLGNIVTGTQSGQLYTYAGGVDQVNMTGGHAQVLVGGLGTKVTAAGGNNMVGVALGLDPQGLLASNLVATNVISSYNGGAPVAASTDSLGNSFSGDNAINFAAATHGLVMNIVDPSGTAPSTVALNVPSGTFADNATFRNFQNIIGSNDGDNITITNCSTLNRILLGTGNNDVVLNAEATSNNSLGVVGITAGPGDNNFWLTNGSNALIGTADGTSNIIVESGSTLHAELGATSDVVDASNDVVSGGTLPLIDVQTEAGMHTLTLNNEQANITLDGGGSNNPKANGDWTIINDAPGRTSADTLIITLGSDMSSELVCLNSNGSISFYSTDDSNQRLDYNCSTLGTNQDNGDAIIAGTTTGSLQQSFISIDQLVTAMNLDTNSKTQMSFNGQGISGFSLASLYQIALNAAPASQVTHA